MLSSNVFMSSVLDTSVDKQKLRNVQKM